MADPAIGMTMGLLGILDGAAEFMKCCEIYSKKEITVWFLNWEKRLQRLRNNPGAMKVINYENYVMVH